MICGQCEREGKKSKVYVGLPTGTLMGWVSYYDEDGNYVNEDPNVTTTDYSCSNGHRFQKVTCRGKSKIEELPGELPWELPKNIRTAVVDAALPSVGDGSSGKRLTVTDGGYELKWTS